MMNMAIYIELGALIAVLFILYLLYRFLKSPVAIILNSIAGIVILFLLNAIFHLGIPINFWSVATVALGGLAGVLLVLIFHFLGIAF